MERFIVELLQQLIGVLITTRLPLRPNKYYVEWHREEKRKTVIKLKMSLDGSISERSMFQPPFESIIIT